MSLTRIRPDLLENTTYKNYFTTYRGNPGNGDLQNNEITPFQRASVTFVNNVPTSLALNSGGMVLNTTATNPLAQTVSLSVAKPALNVIGSGFISGAMTIDREDLGKVLSGSFSYELSANPANFDASGQSTQSLEIWIYEAVSQTWIQPAIS